MKQTLNSFLQSVFQFVKSIPAKMSKVTRKMYRNAIAMTAGVSMVTTITSAAVGSQGSGRSAMVAFAETPEYKSRAETVLEEADTTETSASGKTKQDTEDSSEEEDPESNDESGEAVIAEDALEEIGFQKTAQEEEIWIVQKDKTMDIRTDRREEQTEQTEEQTEETEEEAEAESAEEKVYETCSLSESEYHVLLKIVQAEAGICDETGKILIANVILNRLENDEFPDTISGVVYQKNQFSPVSNGTIHTCKVTEETIEAVDKALKGEDLSDGALYFMNRGASTRKNVNWFDSNLKFLFKHEQHEFFK